MVFLTPFSTVLQLYCSGQCTYPCFPGVLLTNTPYNILSKPLSAFPNNHCQNNRQQERGMNPVTMTIINHGKEYWQSQQPPVLNSAMPLENGINSIPNNKISNFSIFKTFADDKIIVTEKLKFVFGWVENVVGKENAGYQHFLLFPLCF